MITNLIYLRPRKNAKPRGATLTTLKIILAAIVFLWIIMTIAIIFNIIG